MQKTLYIIRHCQAAGPHPNASLTRIGRQQALNLAAHLAPLPIERVISSPYTRAVQSIMPFAQRRSLPIVTDVRLIERILSADMLAEWPLAARALGDTGDCACAGESSGAAAQRAMALLHDVLAHPCRTTAIVTHSNLMTLLLQYFDPSIGCPVWRSLSNPDVYHVDVCGVLSNVNREMMATA